MIICFNYKLLFFYRNNLAKSVFFILQVINIIFKVSFKDYNISHANELKQLIELQAILIHLVAISKNSQ